MQTLSNLGIGRKFIVLGVLASLAVIVPATLYWRAAVKDLDFVTLEAAGTPTMRGLYTAIRVTQEHRGLSAGALAGNAKARDARPAKAQEADQAIDAMTALLAGAAGADKLRERWAESAAQWRKLASEVAAGTTTGPDSFRRHTEIVGAQMAVLSDAMDFYVWSLDPEINTYFTMSATAGDGVLLTERLGQLRAAGTRMLTQQKLTPDDRRQIGTLVALATDGHDRVRSSLTKAMVADPAFAERFKTPLAELQKGVTEALELAIAELELADQATHDPNAYFATMTGVIKRQFDVNQIGTELIDRTLQARAATVRNTLFVGVVACVLLALGFGLFAWWVAQTTTRGLRGAQRSARAIAEGDLTAPVPQAGRDEVGQLLDALRAMQTNLSRIVGGVRGNAESVATASAQIAQGNNDLSSRTEQQASALQETAASMEELGSTVTQNADNARQANQLAQSASTVATQGGHVVGRVVETMKGINDSSRKIADIIGVIDGIAFQTNILALNAAVEAARAGEQGRGFAVVASEVRNLAQRSAGAAKEIKALITASVERVEQGTALVDQAGTTMSEVVASIRRVTDIVAEISGASTEQSSGVAQIGEAVSQMDQATQQNAALVEESAAAAESLKAQAEQLVSAVSVFRLAPA
ncbi:methyl-accepting chemotaxis protein [uncultured Methylibium sp.]|uniref:methyl-accepting chemotaxis protein n=1 Tax=uncultured Methylibium sp. TaxID=381093 RepID=UPI0025F14924|nr:methyl-accepting chemotaxis protein [uncultured Methylibium sp.]